MKLLSLIALAAPTLLANAIFNAPAGCAALAPAPDVTGVQCFGSFTQPDPAQPLSAQFSGGGNGPLWAASATLDYDFFTSSLIIRAIGITANVNGGSNSVVFLATLGSQQHTGSLTIPLAFGEALDSWSLLVSLTTATSDGSRTIDIPTSGAGLRLLVDHTPPSSAIPEPATAGLLALASAMLLICRAKCLRRWRRMGLMASIALAPLAAAPIFTAPPGCTAIQPSPGGEGVQCYGANAFTLEFSGSGTGPLWANAVVLEWDFSVSREHGSTLPVIVATVNGEPFFRIFDVIHQAQARRTGSASIPFAPGSPLDSWSVAVNETWGGSIVGGPVLSAKPTVSTPLDGVGFRFLASHQPPATSAIPEPATAGLLALASAMLLICRAKCLRRWRRAGLMALMAPIALAPLTAAPIFTAPAGCTAIQSTPGGEGVACYGDTGLVRSAPELSFAGGGTGPLWASEVVFEWDFEVGGGGGNIVLALALVNGEPAVATYPMTFEFVTPYSGSLSIPYTPGTVLSSWSMLAQAIPNTLISGESRSLATPAGGAGLRLVAVNQPPSSSAVPEPATWLLSAAGSLLALGRAGIKRRKSHARAIRTLRSTDDLDV